MSFKKPAANNKKALASHEQQLIRPDKAKSSFKGVSADRDRYQARCDTPPCSNNYLGTFDIPENDLQHLGGGASGGGAEAGASHARAGW